MFISSLPARLLFWFFYFSCLLFFFSIVQFTVYFCMQDYLSSINHFRYIWFPCFHYLTFLFIITLILCVRFVNFINLVLSPIRVALISTFICRFFYITFSMLYFHSSWSFVSIFVYVYYYKLPVSVFYIFAPFVHIHHIFHFHILFFQFHLWFSSVFAQINKEMQM